MALTGGQQPRRPATVARAASAADEARALGGFTLIELLVASALTLVLLGFLVEIVTQLIDDAQVSSDHAEVIERGQFVVAALRGAMAQVPVGGLREPDAGDPQQVSAFDVCRSPLERLPGSGEDYVRVGSAADFPCLPLGSVRSQSSVVVLETRMDCLPLCDTLPNPSFLVLSPGCDPLFSDVPPEIRLGDPSALPGDCGSDTRIQVLQRVVFYLRDYAWRPGDGIGALMQKRLKPTGGMDWAAAEMLAPGVGAFVVEPLSGVIAEPCTEEDDPCDPVEVPVGLSVDFLVRGWRRDSTISPGGAYAVGDVVLGPFDDQLPRQPLAALMLGDYQSDPDG
ncbi:PulJ/GspJ family protein [Luminiphilus syltensis]|uniref:PulJ/GspJ family protein n=1 Tax=Luminiphilus syltensis TaxID=1341119 RepID=UPI0012B5C2D2|nr:hypothetical protein [Luminiphilus syltensis]